MDNVRNRLREIFIDLHDGYRRLIAVDTERFIDDDPGQLYDHNNEENHR